MAAATESVLGTVILKGGDLLGSDASAPSLIPTGVTPGSYVAAGVYVDQKGRSLYTKNITSFDFPCSTVFACGMVKVGTNITVAGDSEISIPLATTSSKGVVIVGSGFSIVGCVLSVDYDIATTASAGMVIVPTTGHIGVDGSGNISVPLATESSMGIVEIGIGLDVDGSGIVNVDAQNELPDATTSSKGVVQIGTNIDVAAGVISIPNANGVSNGVIEVGNGFDVTAGVVDLTVASGAQLGGIKVGSGLVIAAGVLSFTHDDATTTSKGIVQIQSGTGLDVTAGVLSGDNATTSTKGVVEIGDYLSVAAGVVDADIATISSLGVIQVGANLGIDGSGILSRGQGDATHTSKGIVQIDTAGNGLTVTAGVLSLDDTAVITKGGVSIGSGGNINVTAGEISVPEATTTIKGVMEVPGTDELDVTTGTLTFTHSPATTTDLGGVKIPSASVITNASGSIDVQDATGAQKGVVQVGSNLTVAAGEINVDKAGGATTFGILRSADTNNLTITAGEIDVGSNVPVTNEANAWTKAQRTQLNTDTYVASWTPDFSLSNTHKMALTGNVTINKPTNMIAGQRMIIIFEQDATGSRTGTFNSAFLFSGSETLSTAGTSVDVVHIIVVDTNTMICQLIRDFK